jgi:hypothetical protein
MVATGYTTINSTTSRGEWIIDSGATALRRGSIRDSANARNATADLYVQRKPIEAIGMGTVILRTNPQHALQLTGALLVPAVRHNLLAVGRLDGLCWFMSAQRGACT